MATRTLTARIILRNDTSANWTATNPTLLKGEIGLETDTLRYKIGNGTDDWNLLPFFANLSLSEKTSLLQLIQMLENDDFGKVDDVTVNGTSVLENKVGKVVIGELSYSTSGQADSDPQSFTGNIVLHKVAKTGSYKDLLDKLNVVDNLDSTSATDALSANQGRTLKAMVQALPTGQSYTTLQAMISALNSYSNTQLNVGANLYLQQMNIPDFWVYSKEVTSVPYTYTSDSAFVSAIQTNGSVQVGYYKVSLLETAKVDLSNYYTKSQVDELISGVISTINIENYYNKTETDSLVNSAKEELHGEISSLGETVSNQGQTIATQGQEIQSQAERISTIESDETIIRTTDTLILNGGSSEG